MGLLIEGQWRDKWYDTEKTGGRFKRQESSFRDWITADGSSGFKAEPGRYRLYVSYACPWAHRTLILRKLKGLDEMIPVTAVHWRMGGEGWEFRAEDGADEEPLYGFTKLYELYRKAEPDYTGRVTVPVLWDERRETIVNNESAEILRMLNSAFDGLGAKPGDFYPEALRSEIDSLNETIYHKVNNGVYKAGFATRQEVYEEAVTALFATLESLEKRLAGSRYLTGPRITEADWRLFTTLLRFDPVYHGHFKCNLKRLADYPNLWGYMLDLCQQPGVMETVRLDHIKKHYYVSHETINPTGIVPLGPEIDLTAPHGRERF